MSEQTPVRRLSSIKTPPPRRRARRRVAAYAGGALTAAGALGLGVLFGQVLIARWTIPGAEAPPPRCGGDYGTKFAGAEPVRLAVIGDSTAAGYGVHTRAETPGALLATWIADAAQRPVRLTCPAVVGSVSAWLPAQVETAIEAGVDLAIIFIGANDVTARASEAAAAAHLAEAVRSLRAAGAEVVVATCPDLGAVGPILPPLRWLAGRWSRQLAAAQTVAVVRAGGRTVSLGDLLGPRFAADRERMFGSDRFHPSAEGYRVAAAAVLPSALEALGVASPTSVPTLLSVPEAAAAAVRTPGAEVSAIGPLAKLRRRSRHRSPAAARKGRGAVPSLTGAANGRSRSSPG